MWLQFLQTISMIETSNVGSATALQSTNMATFPLSGCNALGFPSSACAILTTQTLKQDQTRQPKSPLMKNTFTLAITSVAPILTRAEPFAYSTNLNKIKPLKNGENQIKKKIILSYISAIT